MSMGRGCVVVTGGAGYIGSHACAALYEAGYVPVTYDSLQTGNEWAVRFGPFVQGDIRDETVFRDTLRRYRPVAVLHFAALSLVGEALQRCTDYYSVNVGGTLSVLAAMRSASVKNIVFSSTAAVYGTPTCNPISEDSTLQPCNPYGGSKLQSERVLSDLTEWTDIRHVSLRYFNAAGAHPTAVIGEAHEPETHLIPRLLRSALETQKRAANIFGSDYDTADGTCIRDYIHVSDLANAHVRALEYLIGGGYSEKINIGTGRGYSVHEVLRAVECVTGTTFMRSILPRRVGDPPCLVADPTKAKHILGFAAKYNNLEEIVASAWSWHLRYHGAEVRAKSGRSAQDFGGRDTPALSCPADASPGIGV